MHITKYGFLHFSKWINIRIDNLLLIQPALSHVGHFTPYEFRTKYEKVRDRNVYC